MPETKYFPNVPVSHWNKLRTQFKKSIPGTVSSNYLATVLDTTEVSAKANILPSLKATGLIDGEGKTNQDMANQFRDDEAYARLCQEIIDRLYPAELKDAFPSKPLDREKVIKWFMSHGKLGESAATRIAAFYIALVDADPVASTSSGSSSKPKEAKSKPVKAASASPKIETAPPVAPTPPTSLHNTASAKSAGPALNINIQIHISSDASADQIKNIFENMAKYVYKNEVND